MLYFLKKLCPENLRPGAFFRKEFSFVHPVGSVNRKENGTEQTIRTQNQKLPSIQTNEIIKRCLYLCLRIECKCIYYQWNQLQQASAFERCFCNL